MAVRIARSKLTFDEWLRLPETNQLVEIIDGELRMSPSPSGLHQLLLANLVGLLQEYIPADKGLILPAPMDVVISRSPLRVRQPDVMVVLFREDGWQDVQSVLNAEHGAVVPDLIVEILSPHETRKSLQEKLDDYCHIGVREGWVVSPESLTVEVLRLSEQGPERVGLYHQDESVRSEILPELQIDARRLFAHGNITPGGVVKTDRKGTR